MSTFNDLPDYEALFGELDFKEGDESRSVYSPAAYLADLLQMMDDEFTSTTDVQSRRPDIRKIILDYENTFEEIPYLEVVNEALEIKISEYDLETAEDYEEKGYKEIYNEIRDGVREEVYDTTLANAKYPFNMPFSLNHEEVKLYLKHLGISSEELYKTFSLEHDDTIISREYLNLSQEEYNLVIASDNTDTSVEEYYDYNRDENSEYDGGRDTGNIGFRAYMSNITTLLETTDLTGVQIRELLYQKLREEEYGHQFNFFANYGLGDSAGYATLDDNEEYIVWSNDSLNDTWDLNESTTYNTVPYEWYDRVNRFVRFANKIGISYTDLDLILRNCCDNTLDADAVETVASVKKLKEAFDVDYDVVVALLTNINEVGQTEGNEPADHFNRIFNNKCVQFDERYILGSVDLAVEFQEEADYTEIAYYDDLFSDDNYDFRKRVRYVLGLSKTDLEKIIQRLDDRKGDEDKEIDDSFWMLADNKMKLLNFLYRFTKLASVLDISHEELFTLLDVLELDPTIANYNQQNIFLSYLPSQQNCYEMFLDPDITDTTTIKNLQWLIHTLHYTCKWMMSYGFTAEDLWGIATGKFKTEAAEKVFKATKITALDGIYQGFKPLVLNKDSFVMSPFDQRASGVIYRTIETIQQGKMEDCDVRLINYGKEEAKEIAHKAVDQLSWVTSMDFMGLGIEEKLSEKIFRNLVFRGYLNEQGIVQLQTLPEETSDFQLETDFDEYKSEVFEILSDHYREAEAEGIAKAGYKDAEDEDETETEDAEGGVETEADEISFSVFLSDFEGLNLPKNELDELYDNLIFNNYIDEEGNVQYAGFFDEEGNEEDFDVNIYINDHASEVYGQFEKVLKMFEKGRLVISKSIFDELPFKEKEIDELVENLIFNEYIDKNYVVKDKNLLFTEDADDFELALQFYPHRHAILRVLRESVEKYQKDYATINSESLSMIANKIVAKWAYQDLQSDYLNGVQLLPEARGFFMDEENKKELTLSYYFDNLPGTIVFDRMKSIIETTDSFHVTEKAFMNLKFSEEEVEEVMEILQDMETITDDYKLPIGSLEYYLDSNNALTFSVEEFEDYNKDIFFLLQAVAKRVKEAQDVIQHALMETAKKQDDFLFGQLQGVFGTSADVMQSISKEVFSGKKDLKAAWMMPILSAVNVLDTITEEPSDASFNIAFRRIRQFSLLINKLQLSKEEVELSFRDQNLVAKFPEPIELDEIKTVEDIGDGIVETSVDSVESIDAILEGDDFIYLFYGGKYWIYRKSDYELVDKTDLEEDEDLIDLQRDDDDLRDVLENDPIRLLFEKEEEDNEEYEGINVTAAFKDKEGNTYIFSDDRYFLLPYGSDTWDERENEFGNVDNNFEAMTEIDGAYKNEEGLLFLFANDEYVRYSDGYDYIDEEYPKKIAESWKDENLKVTLPEPFANEPGAGFEGTDGYTYFFHDHSFISSQHDGKIMNVADFWGKMEYTFKGVDHIDAILKDGASMYLFAGEVMVKYTDCLENEGIQVAEGFPKRIIDHYTALPYEFAKGIDAAFRGDDGKLHFIKDEYAVSFNEEDTEVELLDLAGTWGIVKNNIQTNGTIDATLAALDGRVYIFSGDQYYRYSTRDYSKVDSGYPRTTSEDFEGLEQVEAAFVLGGKTYLFGVDENGDQMYVRYSTPDYTEVDEEDEDESTYVTPVESLPDVEEVETFPREQNDDEWWSFPQSLIDAGFEKVDAVFNAPKGVTYLFSGEYVVEFNEANRWWSEPEKITEKWDNLPFTTITAAFAGKDGKIYLFSGTEYIRISDADFRKVDNGYPRTISKFWGEVENNIEKHRKVDAAVVLESREDEEDDDGDDYVEINRHTYLFAGDQIFRYLEDDYTQVEQGYPKKLSNLKDEPRFEELKAEIHNVTAAYADDRNVYLFEGHNCHVISDEEDHHDGVYETDDFTNISAMTFEYGSVYTLEDSTWKRLSSLEVTDIEKVEETPNFLDMAPTESFKTSLSAVLRGTDNNTYLFNGTQCYNTLLDLTYETSEEWGRPRNNIDANETIDAAFVGRDGKTYVFSGDQYFVYESETYVGQEVEDAPELISNKWGLDAVMLAYVRDDKTYLFEKPGEDGQFRYVMYSNDTYEMPDAGYPKTTDISFFGIPTKQAAEGFDRFDTILMHGENMIFIKDQDFIRYNTLEENWSYPKELDLLYNDIPFNKTTFQDIKTAFEGKDGTIYFFDADHYITYSNNAFSEITEIKDNWGLVQNNFADAVDTAFVYNGQVTYLFSGNKYVRYSTSDYRYVDEGYPKEVGRDLRTEKPFSFMPKEFQYAIDEIEESEEEIRITGVYTNPRNTYVFLNDKLYVGSRNRYEVLNTGHLGRVRNNFWEKGMIDAAFVDSDGKTYLFSGDQYIRYSDSYYKYVDEGYPKLIVDDLAEELGIDSVPNDFHYGIDAAFTDNDGVVYLFRDENYITSSDNSEQSVTDTWGKLKNNFLEDDGQTIDAAYIDEEGRLLAFKGDQYIQYTDPRELFTENDQDDRGELRKYTDPGYPMLIEDHHARLPEGFREDLDAAFMFEGRMYFTQGTEYVMAIDGYHTYDNNIYPQEFKYRWGDWIDYLLSDMLVLARFKKLEETFSNEEYSLTKMLHGGEGAAKEPYLAVSEVFGFDKDEVRWVKQNNAFLEVVSSFEKQFEMELIIKLYDILTKAQEMKVDASKLYDDVWTNLYGSTIDRATAAKKIYQMLGTEECNDNYKARLDQIEGEYNTLKRNVLVPYAIATDSALEDARDLYEKMLVDVMMESEATTSRIKEATAAMQLYFHRYFINLEKVDLTGSNDEQVKEKLRLQWDWMRNYRVWEANRKVFLYPENYIRPELRDSDSKTPAFETLEQELMQGEITEDAVERVYKKYLDEYTEVSRLKIAGGYVYDEQGSSGNNDKNLVLFGRTKTDPMRYYYRFANFEDGESSKATWDPWKKVDVAIEADKVYPVYAFHRVFVFWTTTEKFVEEGDAETGVATVSDPDDNNNQEVTSASSTTENTKYRVNIYFSFYNLNEEWTQPQLLNTSIETDSSFTDVDLYVENSTKLEAYDDTYENIVVRCKYTYYSFDLEQYPDIFEALLNRFTSTNTVAYSFTSEFVTTKLASDLSYENNGQTIFDLLFPNENATLDSDDMVMLNSSENTTDGPWFAFDYKGGSFLVKPMTPAISSEWPLSLSANIYLPSDENITAAFYDGTSTYYLTSNNQYFTYDVDEDSVPDEKPEVEYLENTSRWGQVRNNIQITGEVDAGYNDGTNTYLFSGDQFFRYVSGSYTQVEQGYPQLIANNTVGFPTDWGQIDAAFKGEDGNVYLFNNATGKYVILGSDTEYNTEAKWGSATSNSFTDPNESVQVEASFAYGTKVYMFNGNQYIRYSSPNFGLDSVPNVDEKYPKIAYVSDFLMNEFDFDADTVSAYADKTIGSAYVYPDTNILVVGFDGEDSGATFNLNSQSVTNDSYDIITAFSYTLGNNTIRVEAKNSENKIFDLYKDDIHKGTLSFVDGDTTVAIDSVFLYGGFVFLFSGQDYMVLKTSKIVTGNPADIAWENANNQSATGQIASDFAQGATLLGIDFDNSKVDAAYIYDNSTYIFSGANYIKYSGTDYDTVVDSGTITSLITNFPEDWSQVDAVIPYFDLDNNEYHYFFNNETSDEKNTSYILVQQSSWNIENNNSNDIYGGDIVDYWGNLDNNLEDGTIEAAYIHNNNLYLFSGDQFGVHTITDSVISEYMDSYAQTINNGVSSVSAAFVLNDIPYLISDDMYYKVVDDSENVTTPDLLTFNATSIKGNWGNFPSDMQTGMSAALDKNDKLYFFKDSEYVEYDTVTTDSTEPAIPYEIINTTYEIVRLTTSTADALNQALLASVDTPTGIGGLLNTTVQQIDEVPSFSSDASSSGPTTIEADGEKVPDEGIPVNSHLDFNSANGIYYWEIFFHAPFHIAMSLNADQKFEYAKEWYEYIFDPTEVSNYWKFLPFLATDISALITSMEGSLQYFIEDSILSSDDTTFTEFAADLIEFGAVFQGYTSLTTVETDTSLTLSDIENWESYDAFVTLVSGDSDNDTGLNTTNNSDSDRQTLLEAAKTNLEEVLAICTKLNYRYVLFQNTTSQLTTYLEDPFDPHTIAEYRKIAYRKAIMMNYIDNLLDWGDMLFRQYTRESINEARMLYVLAYDLLGKKPENLGEKVLSDDVSYIDLKHDTHATDDDYDFIFQLENTDVSTHEETFSFAGTVHDSVADPYFFIPENSLFMEYWDRVEDRLHKIRNSLNIVGDKQSLALFQPPIDPMALVNAVAGGGGLSGALADLAIDVPHYRFSYMISKAKEFAQMVDQFGEELLAAIEKKDSEALSILQNSNEYSILDLSTQIKEKQIEDAEQNILSLQKSKETAEAQKQHYEDLISDGWLDEEQQQINLMIGGIALQSTATVGYILSAIASIVPQFSLGPFNFGVTTGGMQVGEFLEKTNESFQTAGEVLMTAGELVGMRAQHKRSIQDWELQRDMASGEIEQLKIQVVSAEIQKAISKHELDIHEKEIENNKSIAKFMTEKFSNKDLYQWMSGQLSGMYYDAYKMAHDMAKKAEKAFQFETGTKATDISHIGGMYWDSQKKGLLAGKRLNLDLSRMEKAYMEQDVRTFEITKNISLLELDPLAFMQLKSKGVCEFRFTEALFDYDFPGHFKRQVKTIALAFDAGEEKYVNATLTQLNNKVIVEEDIKAVKYLLDAKGTQPLTIRNDWRPNQQVALSYVDQYTDNNGLFELRYWDDRYLPFEGTGAVSLWRLELNGKKGFNYDPSKVLDVTIKLRYTANQGGSAFGNTVKAALKPYDATSFFDIAYNFADEWNDFMLSDKKDLMLRFNRDMFPSMSGSKATGIFLRYDYVGDQKPTFLLNDETKLADSTYLEVGNLNMAKEGSEWKFTVQGDKSMIKNVEMIVLYKAKVE